MANRRFLLSLSRKLISFHSLTPSFPQHLHPIAPPRLLHTLPKHPLFSSSLLPRHFSSSEDDEDRPRRVMSPERIAEEAAHIGYKVLGPVQDSDLAQKPYQPVFAVVKVGNQQFKVSNDDTITIEKLKYCDVNDKLILNQVLMLGSRTQTIIGRPILPDASVHAVVEEHALDAKVIIFKKKRRKNYRRKNGHRQELTRLRIIDIQGIEKPEIPEPIKVEFESKKLEKVAVAA